MVSEDMKKIGHRINSRDRSRVNSTITRLNLLDTIYSKDSYINNLSYIDWDVEYTGTHQEGRTHWNPDDKTLETGLDGGSILQHGQEIHLRATNKTGATIDNGQVVFISGAQGQRPTITLADNDSIATSLTTIGITTQEIKNNTNGYVTIMGMVRDLNTADFSNGDLVWLSDTAGGLTSTRPASPAISVAVGVIAYSHATEGIAVVKPVVVQRLAWLSDVDARGNQAEWDLLRWDNVNSKWIITDGILSLPNLSTYADNAAALVGGLVAGDLYKTSTGDLKIVI